MNNLINMKIEQINDILNNYNILCDYVLYKLSIVYNMSYNLHIMKEDLDKITFEDDIVYVSYIDYCYGYSDTKTYSFPFKYLIMEDDNIKEDCLKIKQEEEMHRKIEAEKYEINRIKKIEENEFLEYKRLKKKFNNK